MQAIGIMVTGEGAGLGWIALAPQSIRFTMIALIGVGRDSFTWFHVAQAYIFRQRMIMFYTCADGKLRNFERLIAAWNEPWRPGVVTIPCNATDHDPVPEIVRNGLYNEFARPITDEEIPVNMLAQAEIVSPRRGNL